MEEQQPPFQRGSSFTFPENRISTFISSITSRTPTPEPFPSDSHLSDDEDPRSALTPTQKHSFGMPRGSGNNAPVTGIATPANTGARALLAKRKSPTTPSADRSHTFSRKHIEQAIKLAGDVLEEERKGEDGDAEYAIDCYFSSIDYLISAIPASTAPKVFASNSARQTVLHSKVLKLLDKVSPNSTLNVPGDNGGAGRWWSMPVPARLNLRRTPASTPTPDAVETVPGSIQPPTELVAGCVCGRKVCVQVPQWVLDSAVQTGAAAEKTDRLPRTFAEALIAACVVFAEFIKRSPIPYILGLSLSFMWVTLIALDTKFNLRSRFIKILGDVLETIFELDRALGIHRAVGEVVSVVSEAVVKAAVAFSRAEAYRPPGDQPVWQDAPPTTPSPPQPTNTPRSNSQNARASNIPVPTSLGKQSGYSYSFGRQSRASAPATPTPEPVSSSGSGSPSVRRARSPQVFQSASGSSSGPTPGARNPTDDSSRGRDTEFPPSYVATVVGGPDGATGHRRVPSGWARSAAGTVAERLGFVSAEEL